MGVLEGGNLVSCPYKFSRNTNTAAKAAVNSYAGSDGNCKVTAPVRALMDLDASR